MLCAYVAKCSVLLAMFACIRTYVHNIIIIGTPLAKNSQDDAKVTKVYKTPSGLVTLSFLTDEDPGPEGILTHMNWVKMSESSDLYIVL